MSEGHASAQRINASLTGDPYLLQPVGRLHRVDTSQLPAGVDGAAAWHCRTDKPTRTTTDKPATQKQFSELFEDENEGPVTSRQFFTLIALGASSWAVVGLMFWLAFQLAQKP